MLFTLLLPVRWLALIALFGLYEFRWVRAREFEAAAAWLFPHD